MVKTGKRLHSPRKGWEEKKVTGHINGKFATGLRLKRTGKAQQQRNEEGALLTECFENKAIRFCGDRRGGCR